ncbi:sensor histidine kinase N-terminal domain-containing protein [Chromobacterium haemolyticum]|nr:sensor histidine kinase N-terminal domain-containing protein [Chromobacterium haemolyticum]
MRTALSRLKPASLRKQLLLGLSVPLLLMLALDGWMTYNRALQAANTAFDRMLLSSGRAIAPTASPPMTAPSAWTSPILLCKCSSPTLPARSSTASAARTARCSQVTTTCRCRRRAGASPSATSPITWTSPTTARRCAC